MARVKKAKTTIAESGWKLTDEHRAWARFKTPHVDVERETENFVDYWTAHGKVMADWDATFRVWMRRAPEFARNHKPMRPVVETPYIQGNRPTAGAPVVLRDHPLFKMKQP